ncbi:MAG: TonB-dependent receptor [Flammeovirgaceae bacterium]|nr:TonB-dependent receptor [Flammeovirgaceae bacterium]
MLDFLKIRAGYGTSANFPDPYNTRAILPIVASYQSDALGNVPVQGQNYRLANSNLKPELQRELEFGLEAQLLENLVKLDLSYYNRSAKDQILARQLIRLLVTRRL